MSASYRDRWIECADDGLRVRAYYFPWGTKRIPYRTIRSVRRVQLDPLHGSGRIWGTANPRYWASLDPLRPKKRTALILDVGGPVHPFITPDDPDAVVAAIREHTDVAPAAGAERGPFI